ncbi:MAG: glycosyltransferase family 39 protein [Candidatus Sulfotelmatobacter sp.]
MEQANHRHLQNKGPHHEPQYGAGNWQLGGLFHRAEVYQEERNGADPTRGRHTSDGGGKLKGNGEGSLGSSVSAFSHGVLGPNLAYIIWSLRLCPNISMLPANISVNTESKEGGNWRLDSVEPLWTHGSRLTLALMTVAAAALRFLFLARKPFWFDECFSVEVARLSWHDMVRLLWRREANMSLYYLLLRGWLHFGSSPFFIRGLSVIFSLATLPAIFWLAGRLFDRRVALVAVALMSFNAYSIRYAQEARSYSLFVLLATLSSGFFVATLREPSRRKRMGYALASGLAVYAHLYALLLLAAQWLSLRGKRHRTPTRPHALRRAWIWIGVASFPLLIFAAKTGAGPIRWIQPPGARDLLDFAEHLSGNDGLPLLLLYAVACFAALLPLQKMAGVFRAEVDGPDNHWAAWRLRFLLTWMLFPVAVTVLLSLVRPIFLARYFIFCLPALLILGAAGLARLRSPLLLAASVAAMLLLSLQGTFSYYDHDFDLDRDDSQAAVNYILDHGQVGDAILFHIAEARVPYEFFKSLRTPSPESGVAGAGPEIIYPRHGDHLDYRDFTGKPTSDFVQSLAGQNLRVWLVLMSNGNPGHPDATTLMLNQTLGASFPRVETKQFPEVEVRVYSRP